MLLVTADSIPSEVAAELARLKPQRIVVLGGPAVLSQAVVNQLAAYSTGG
jgi:putative cell wall-binding protein